jgi:hypothetical protein
MKLVVQLQNQHLSMLSKLDTPDEIVMPKQVLNMSNGKERGMFWKAIVVVVGVTFAVVVAVSAGLAKRFQCRTVYSLVVELRLSFF